MGKELRMLAGQDDIIQFIPQRMPIVMVTALLEAADDHAITQLLIQPDNIFVSEKQFTEPGLVENIAQTAAVQVGYKCMTRNIPVPIGFIAAVRSLQILALPAQNTTITTFVNITNSVMDITLVHGRIEQDGKVLCSCEMRIFAKLQS